MINVSQEYKEKIQNDRKFIPSATITLVDSTVLQITSDDIMAGGVKGTDSASPSGSFQIGSAVIGSNTLILDNKSGKFDSYNFDGAVVRPKVGLQLSATVETINKGVFTVDSAIVAGNTIVLESLDNMSKFDTPFSAVTRTFPCTTLQLLQSVCTYCGVSLATSTFTNSNFTIARRPSDEATTCREIVAWIAQMAGCFAKCNTNGALELKWYDIGAFESETDVNGGVFDSATPYASGDTVSGGTFTDYNSGDAVDGGTFTNMDRYHHIYALSSCNIGTDDIIITGIQVKAKGTDSDYGETVLFGSNGYVIEITNPLIQEGTASIIANSVGAKIVGMRFRQCSINAISDPCREAGDVAYLTDKNGNSYPIIISNITYQIGSYDQISSDAETPSKKKSVRFDATTKSIVEARQVARQEISSYDLAVQQLNSVALNSMGFYPTTIIQGDGSRIDYAHDKPTLAESQIVYKKTIDGFFISKDGGVTYTSGYTSDGNILANVLTAIGVKAEWLVVGGTISGLRIEATTGKIGPYDINTTGLKSNTMEFFDNGNYPLIWMEKPGYNSKVNGSAKANYEPSVAVVRAVEDGVETNVHIMARDDTHGTKGMVKITRINLSSGLYKSESVMTENGIEWTQYDSSGAVDSYTQFTPNNLLMMKGGYSFVITLDPTDGTAYINATKIMINGVQH